ncbi:MAG: glycosyltransferase family 2 protein [Natrialbaceae archaeon]|nr:glycosyltransferase family 2 protein [Natrialbaceae archaeon]
MYAGRSVGVVVTAYREADHVADVIESVPSFVDRVYVVDDASPDNCWSVIRETASRLNQRHQRVSMTDGGEPRRVVPLRHQRNRGYGAAVKTGYRRAVEDGIDVVAVMNGDGQMDPAILDRIIDPVAREEAAYAKGNRLLRSSDRAEMSQFRLLGNVALSVLTKFAAGYWRISDPQNGYTAIATETIREIDLSRLTDEYGFLNELLVALNVDDYRIADVAMTARYGDEQSTIRYPRFIRRLSWLLLRNFWWRLKVTAVRDFNPAVAYYIVGGIGLVLSAVSICVQLLRSGERARPIGSMLLSLLALAMAIDRDADESESLEIMQYDPPDDRTESVPTIEIDH